LYSVGYVNYRELDGDEYEVVVRRAKSWEEMRPPVPRVEEAPERTPWAVRRRVRRRRRARRKGKEAGIKLIQ
jgi:hypothetical protein